MGEGLKRRVELIRQQMQDSAPNGRDRFKEKVAGKTDNDQSIPGQ
jgi:hypothetical protein